MTKYRFKTAKEFQDDNNFDYRYNVPNCWNISGDMDKYMGQDVPDIHIDQIESGNSIIVDRWVFQNDNIVGNTQTQSSKGTNVGTTSPYLLIRRK